MKSDWSVVLKYFDLVDEFLRVRVVPEDATAEVFKGLKVLNRANYRRAVIDACVVDYQGSVLPLLGRCEEECDISTAEDLLYQICIDVNPNLEIHQVALPGMEGGVLDDLSGELVRNQEEKKKALLRVANLEEAVKKRILGQDEAVECLTMAVKKAAVGLKEPHKPVGTFFLIGRTGTGKTEVAKVLAQALYGDPGKLVRVDCSEYALPHEYAKLIGSPPGYIGHGEGGYLTEAVRKKKSCVVLFDEIEKAHFKVHNLLLQILDEGILTDSKGVRVPFNRTLIILTSNLGVEQIDQIRSRMGFDLAKRQSLFDMDLKTVTLEALKDSFRPEFINRIDEVVVFNPLDLKICQDIAGIMLRDIAQLLARNGIKVRFSPGVKKLVAKKAYSEEYGAREIRRVIKKEIEDPLAVLLLKEGKLARGAFVDIRTREGKFLFFPREEPALEEALA